MVKTRDASRQGLAKARSTVVAKMEAMIEAKRKELGAGADEAAVKAALEKDPEWKALHAQCVDANTALEEDRRRTLRLVRERLTRGSAARPGAPKPGSPAPGNPKTRQSQIKQSNNLN